MTTNRPNRPTRQTDAPNRATLTLVDRYSLMVADRIAAAADRTADPEQRVILQETAAERIRAVLADRATVGVAIAIGRNVGDEPMKTDRWNEFRRAVLAAVRDLSSEVYASASGRAIGGEWSEDTFVLTADAFADAIPTLRRALAILARHYGQESVSLLTGAFALVAAADADADPDADRADR